MADLKQKYTDFVKTVVKRGIGLYGLQSMAEICYNSGIILTDKMEIDWMDDNYEEHIKKLLINYGSFNLPARMTAIILARKHGIPVPEELLQKKKKKKRRWFKFGRK